jgi:hypothetical protein
MLHALFADQAHAADANAVARKFGPLWDKYIAVADVAKVSDSGGVSVQIGERTSSDSPA